MRKQYSNKFGNKHQARKPLITALEPRLLLDGAAVATAVEVMSDAQLHHDVAQTDANHVVNASDSHQDTSKPIVIAPTEVRAVDPAQNSGRKEAVFIESNVADYQNLVDNTKAGVEVVLLDSSQDGLSQMTEWAKTHSDYDAIHIISHGSEGSVNLGALNLDRSDISGRASDLAQLGSALTEQGDLLLYGCDVASGKGQAFVDSIAQLTQADVAASNDLTGAADLHGDWNLEYHQGHIKEGAIWDKAVLDHYYSVLAETNSDFSGKDTSDSGGTGFKSLTNGDLVVDNGATLFGGEMFLADTNDNDATITIKADGVDAASFDVSEVKVYNYNTAGEIVLDSSSTIVFKDKDGAVLRTMALNGNTSIPSKTTSGAPTASSPLNIFTLFDNNTTPVTGVAQIDFNFKCNNTSQVNLADLTFTGIAYDNVVAPSSGPSVPSTPDLSAASDTGISSTDHITNDTTPTFTVTGVANGATITLFNDANNDGVVDTGETLATGTASSTSIQLTSSALTSGTYNIKAIQNVGGTDSAATSAQSVTIDTTAPTETIASATFSADTTANGGTNSDFITKTAEQTVSGTLSANLASGESVYLSLDNGANWSAATASVGSNTWSLAGQTLEAGSNTLKVKVTDTAGNDGSIYSQNYVLDTTAPTITSIARQTPTGSSTNADSLVYQVSFSEAVSNLDATDFTVAGTTASVTSVSQVGSTNVYNITVSGGDLADLNGTVSLGFSGSQNIQDTAGNALTSTTPTGTNNVSFDVVNSLTVTTGDNTNDNATFSNYATDLTDGGGLSLAEAMHYASANQTVAFNLASDFVDMNGQTINLVSGVTLDTDSMNALTISNGTLNLQGSATVTNGVGDSLNVASIITGDGQTLTKTGEGRLTLSSTLNSGSSFSTHVMDGSLSISDNGNLGSGELTLDGSSLILQNSSDISHDISLGANGGTITVTNSDVTVSGAISGSGALTHTGERALTLSGNNTFTGGFMLSGSGGVVVADGGNLGSGAVTLSQGLTVTGQSITLANNFVFDGGSMTNANNVTIAGNISGSGSMEKAGAGILNLSGTGNSWSGAATVSAGTLSGTTASLTGNIVNDAAVIFNQSSSGSYSKVISGTGTVTKSGLGAVTFSGANTYTGKTTVSEGELVLDNLNGMALADTSAVALTGTGKLSLSSNETIGNLSGVSGTSVDLGGNTLTVNQTNSSSFAGVMSGTGGLIKTGASMLTLAGANTYTGGTTISSGKIFVSGGSAIADDSAVTVAAGATLQLSTDASETVGSIAGTGSIVANGGTLTVGGNNTSTTFSGVFNGGVAGAALEKVGSGTLTLSGNNNYSGNTTVSGGTLSIASDANLGFGTLVLNSGALSVTGNDTIDNAITLQNSSSLNVASNISAEFSAVISGSGSLLKTGTGTATLSANNTYTGATTLNAGTLSVTGSLSDTSTVVVNSGATLAGSGSIFAANSTHTLTVNGGGFLAPGVPGVNSGAGELTVNGDLVLNGTLKADITGPTAKTEYDQVTVKGDVSLGASSAFDIAYSVSNSGNTFELIDNQGSNVVTGMLNGVAEGGALTSNGHSFQTSYVGGTGNDITLKDNAAPVITSGTTGSVNENAPTSTVIYMATATDAENDTLTYSLTGADAALLSINASTGVVTLKNAADYETKDIYSFNVVVTDNSTGHLTDSKAVTVSVNDLNDNPPVITSGTTGSVNENAPTSTVIYQVTATDADGTAANNTLQYSLSGADANLLDIDAVTGMVTLKASADFETKSSYSFNVIATDNGTSHLTDSKAVTVSVNDLNDNPPVITSGTTGSVNENAPTSTVIYQVTATDADGTAANNTLRYSLSGADANLLDIDAVTGMVTLKASADFETKSSYSFNVIATDNGTSHLTDSKAVTVSVNDLNDNAPVITSSSTGSVNENAPTSTVIYQATATDADGTAANNTLRYSLSGADANLLDINTVTGAVTLKASADFETKSSYSFNVIATDNGTENLTDSKAVTVSVNDLNDNPPVITSSATGSVNENAPTSTVVYQVTATDADGTAANNTLQYSLSGADANLLNIDAMTGAVTLKNAADYETKNTYSFNVVVTDSGTSHLTDSKAVTVSVNDLNDNAPVITSSATGNVNENASTSTVIYQVTATDADGTAANNTLRYSLSGADANLLDINAVTGIVTLKASADFETKSSYSFNVIATDNGTENLTDSKAVTVSVNDLNDNSPVITSSATGSVNENAPASTVIYQVTATDADGTEANNTLRYSLSGADANLLDINAVTGMVTLKASADFETKSSYSFNVIATDNGTSHLTDSKAVTVSVNDLNDNAPVITSSATGSVNENAPTSTVIYQVTATDADGTAANNTLRYSLSGADANLLDIDAVTGMVTLKASADFETKSSYSFNVIATDNGSSHLTDSKAVTVSVNDLNDNAPVITSGATGSVNENAPTSTVIYQVTATDADGTAANNTLQYSLSGADANLLDINTVTGAVTLKASADFETKSSYSFNVIATDNGSGHPTDSKAVVVNVNNVNEAPVLTSGATGSVDGNAPSSTVIYTATATDTDSDTLTYSLTGADAALLNINASTGAVTLKSSADYETKNTYSFNVVVTDNGSGNLTDTKAVVVSVNQVVPPVIAEPPTAPASTAPRVESVDRTSTSPDMPTIPLTPLPAGTIALDRGASGFVGETVMRSVSMNTTDNGRINVGNTEPNAIGTSQPAAVISTSRVAVNVGADGQVQVTPASGVAANTTGLSIANLATQPDRVSIAIADSGAASNYSATLSDGSTLPSWVQIDPVTGEVSMTPPPGQEKISLKINAVDANGNVRVLEVDLDLDKLPTSSPSQPSAEVSPANAVNNGGDFLSLNEQLNRAASQLDYYGHDLMKLLVS
ncbi:cadherin domain-containing protein [Celerinatantimonas diazotrophica]|uniref:Autotransporter-associated beta strand protein n=1 Tax=Celerinatantimonas diazotrophica TaxID=412034 RepID=A0A4R1K3Y4_9GAMM|nr:cadherin domain-containing protein [Celerinatantimonas diazotrophica]TCK58804.1 autotransporter-associated beta strand protein [Celerinatantimonas diazotrophica]CAG9297436.1 hypothetical protein CEDIAZO_02617 [Celerinatantimonas diazotrophica]